MTTTPRGEIRRRIIRRLNSDEWMERHFGIAAHAEDVADAVMELFPEVELAHEHRSRGLILPVAPYIPGQVRATHSLFVLRTEPVELTAGEDTA